MKKTFLMLLFLAGCSALGVFSPQPVTPISRPIQFLPGSSFASDVSNGLSSLDRMMYYQEDEGIQYLPTNVMLSLKRPTNDTIPTVMDELLLAQPERFGLMPNYVNPGSPLPIGITTSSDTEYVPMSGINCSTCHTSMISNDRGQFFLVDGGSSRFQIDVFLGELLKSVAATLLNPVEFEAFFKRYQIRAALPEDGTQLDDKSLTSSLQKTVTTSDSSELESKLKSVNTESGKSTTLTCASYPTAKQLSTRSGMYVYLVRRFAYLFSLAKYGTNPSGSTVSSSGPGRSNPWAPTKFMLADRYLHTKSSYKIPGGPINTPLMWDFDRQHWIFLLGNTNSMVERNMAQGIALLSDFNPDTFETTISIKKLDEVSKYAKKATPPEWPQAILGSINWSIVPRGKMLFQDQCLSCHDSKPTSIDTASANYDYVDVETDYNYFAGQKEKIDGKDLFTDILTPFMTKVKAAAAKNEGITDMSIYEPGRIPVIWRGPNTNAIIAKPLMGVWATPPYLHNGSVPTIRDLLSPANSRPTKFLISGFIYNAKDLGYMQDSTLPYSYELNTNCSACTGNSNEGHEYGTQLTNEDKDALIEFLKSYTADTTFK